MDMLPHPGFAFGSIRPPAVSVFHLTNENACSCKHKVSVSQIPIISPLLGEASPFVLALLHSPVYIWTIPSVQRCDISLGI